MKKTCFFAVFCTLFTLHSCLPLQQQQQQQATPTPVAEGQGNGETDEGEPKPGDEAKTTEQAPENEFSNLGDAQPSHEQQEAALRMLEKLGAEPKQSPVPTAEEPVVIPEAETSEPIYSAVPGGRGLRMGSMAPPEEAASSSDNDAPKPNSVEMHGLRSPSLPKGLPMDINGKLAPSN